jgi:hypothetical protein
MIMVLPCQVDLAVNLASLELPEPKTKIAHLTWARWAIIPITGEKAFYPFGAEPAGSLRQTGEGYHRDDPVCRLFIL